MRSFIIFLLLVGPGIVCGQTEINLIGSVRYHLSLRTEPRRVGGDRNDDTVEASLSAGVEAVFRGEGQRTPVIVRLEYGSFNLDRLNNDFRGEGFQGASSDARMGQLVGQARFLSAGYLQGALAIELIPPEQANNLNVELALGGMFILRERIHATTTWVDPATGIAEPATGFSYQDQEGALVADVPVATPLAAGHLTLSQNMLRRFTPFVELNLIWRAQRGVSSVVGLQSGLQSMLDQDWYNTSVRNSWWLAVKGTFRGRII